jgi:hypothetical protein
MCDQAAERNSLSPLKFRIVEMGLSLSLDSSSQGSLNAITLLSYESGQFSGVSMIAFVNHPEGYIDHHLVLIEPLHQNYLPLSDPAVPVEKVEFNAVIGSILSRFSFRSVQVPKCRVWIHTRAASDFQSFLLWIRKVSFSALHSPLRISPDCLFAGFPNVSFSDILSASETGLLISHKSESVNVGDCHRSSLTWPE